MILEEGDIRIDFSNAVSGKKFDDENHGLSYCMKAVDFIVEIENKILFIEIKDPQDPQITKMSDIEEFLKSLTSKSLFETSLKTKCRDSFLYEFSMDRIHKPIYYLVLICLDILTPAELISQTDVLKNHVPVLGPKKNPWKKRFIEDCSVFNIKTWNSKFEKHSVTRISQNNKK